MPPFSLLITKLQMRVIGLNNQFQCNASVITNSSIITAWKLLLDSVMLNNNVSYLSES